MQIEMWPIDRPKDCPTNARKWSKRAIDVVGASIREFGWRQPVVVDSADVIVIGHLRRAAGKSIGMSECPVHVAAELTPMQIRGLRLADNRTNQESVWDEELLALELQELNEADYDLSHTGFDQRELDALLSGPEDDAAADAAPPLPASPVSRLDDLWLCGGHRVLCADCTSADAVARLLCERKPFLMVTDPPYSVELNPHWRQDAGLQNNTRQSGKVTNDDRADWTPAWKLFPGDVFYVWHAGIHASVVAASLALADFEIRAQLIWKKQRFVISRGAYHWGHEPCWYSVRKGKSAHWSGDRTQSTVWEVDNLVATNRKDDSEEPENAITGHGTQKPVELFRRPICNHTARGDMIYDPFLGSGTAVAAAELTDRVCLGLELDPKYVDVIVQRWQTLAGKKATLDGDGRTFDEIRHERRKEPA